MEHSGLIYNRINGQLFIPRLLEVKVLETRW